MQLLEDTYQTVLLNEKLITINMGIAKIKRILSEEYAKWRSRYGKIPVEKMKQFEVTQEDINIIAAILPVLYAYDKRYNEIFSNIDFKKLEKQLAATDLSWQNFVMSRIPMFFKNKQPANLALVRLVREMGLAVPVAKTTDPETGMLTEHPVYPLHLLHKYIQMNILEKNPNMSSDKKDIIEKLVFDDRTRSQIQTDIDAYNTRTNKHPQPLIPELPEERKPENPRIADIRRRYQALE